MISQIYMYKGELFHLRYLHASGKAMISTYNKEKALKFRIKERNGMFPYIKEVRMEELKIAPHKGFHPSMYQVKYGDHFFEVNGEKENELEIETWEENLATVYDLALTGDPRNGIFRKWVSRKEITPVTELDDNLGYLICDPGGGIICYIVESSETEYLLKTDLNKWFIENRRRAWNETWEQREDGWYYQWVPKEKVYVYKDHDETFRY